jgi:hypothetical protein
MEDSLQNFCRLVFAALPCIAGGREIQHKQAEMPPSPSIHAFLFIINMLRLSATEFTGKLVSPDL